MSRASSQDTCDHFIGSGALGHSWWSVAGSHGISEADSPDDWYVDLREFDPDKGEATGTVKRIDHAAVLRAVNTLARTALDKRPEYMAEQVIRECRAFIKDPADADFDSDLADQVLQYIVHGRVIYR